MAIPLNEDQDVTIGDNSGSQFSTSLQSPKHGLTHGGEAASCAMDSGGIVDCQCCLNRAFSEFTASLPDEDKSTIYSVQEPVIEAGSMGLTRKELTVGGSCTGISS